MYCDLHTHSTCSDGADTPTVLAEKAAEAGLSAVALTDHNTTRGLDEFLSACEKQGIVGVPGVELSTYYKGTEFHISALFVKKEFYNDIMLKVERFQVLKEKSNIEICERLAADGYDISYSDIKEKYPDSRINRFHIAEKLMETGVVSSVDEAMKGLLSDKNKYYTPPERLQSLEVVSYIKSIGAISVLAHPMIKVDKSIVDEFLSEAVPLGLDAMEVIYTEYDEEKTQEAKRLAEKYGILPSGGSDYHGVSKPGVYLGKGRGNLVIPMDFYRGLAAKYEQSL
ncbi:MAG: PHP domain-containing protein [Clostridia bacterium]|nr:PHP domain-containing protein [Clostridia bacterium]